jgi:hypothetical protein
VKEMKDGSFVYEGMSKGHLSKNIKSTPLGPLKKRSPIRINICDNAVFLI